MRFKDLKEDKTAYTTKDHVIYGLWLAHEFLKAEDKADEDKAYEIFNDYLSVNGMRFIKIPSLKDILVADGLREVKGDGTNYK